MWKESRVKINYDKNRGQCWVEKHDHPDPKITWGKYYSVHFIPEAQTQTPVEYSEGCFNTEAEAVAYMNERFQAVTV